MGPAPTLKLLAAFFVSALSEFVCVLYLKKNVLVEQDLLNSLKTDGEFNVYLVKNRDTRPNL